MLAGSFEDSFLTQIVIVTPLNAFENQNSG